MSTGHTTGPSGRRTRGTPGPDTTAKPEEAGTLVILANFVSPLAVDLSEEAVLRQWSEQAPRKIWLTRPGDVLTVPVPLSEAFRRYVFQRLDIPDGSATIITVPDTPGVPMARAPAVHGLLDPLRALVHERPGARLLPTALDEPTVALAAHLGIPVVPYEAGEPQPETLSTGGTQPSPAAMTGSPSWRPGCSPPSATSTTGERGPGCEQDVGRGHAITHPDGPLAGR